MQHPEAMDELRDHDNGVRLPGHMRALQENEMKSCADVKKEDKRVERLACCSFCHSSDVMYRTATARVCCHLAQVLLGKDYSFTASVEMRDGAKETARA